MEEAKSTIPRDSFQNPVYDHSFPDPFVLKHGCEYYAYCTDFGADGLVFPILHSTDLINWQPAGTAMEPLASAPPYYWAPEVTAAGGKFYLYYSVGNEELMELRVAVSDRPDGGFVDSGNRLSSEDFAIDPHVFIVEDGTRYLFYATDFLDHSHIGTGTVVDRMSDWFKLEGHPRPVTRAKFDWQVYDPKRDNKGGVRWHTVEGPFVLSRKGVYFEMFSGGNWQNTTYGVSFATTHDIAEPGEWVQYCDGEKISPILRTLPGKIVGPGHNCVVQGPNNRELYCIYHRWTDNGRVLCVDRMDFAGDRLFVMGASDSPQPVPFSPNETGFDLSWEKESGTRCSRDIPRSFLSEFRFVGRPSGTAAGVELSSPDAKAFFRLPEGRQVVRIDVDGRWARITIDGWQVLFEGWLEARPERLALVSNDVAAEFSSFALTEGFEDLCDRGPETGLNGEWIVEGAGSVESAQRERHFSPGSGESRLTRSDLFHSVDLAVNMRLLHAKPGSEFGILLRSEDHSDVFRLSISASVTIFIDGRTVSIPLPALWTTTDMRQYRLLVLEDRITVYFEDTVLAEFSHSMGEVRFAVFSSGTAIAFDMLRATRI